MPDTPNDGPATDTSDAPDVFAALARDTTVAVNAAARVPGGTPENPPGDLGCEDVEALLADAINDNSNWQEMNEELAGRLERVGVENARLVAEVAALSARLAQFTTQKQQAVGEAVAARNLTVIPAAAHAHTYFDDEDLLMAYRVVTGNPQATLSGEVTARFVTRDRSLQQVLDEAARQGLIDFAFEIIPGPPGF